MASHLSFLDDAVDTFLEAFGIYQSLVDAPTESRSLRAAVNCVRALALALEKGCKHALASVDEYLVVARPDRMLLLQLRRDLLARPVPTIFCSRQPFETITLSQSWETLRELRGHGIAPDAVAAFDQALSRLVTIRNRAYHAEIFEDPAELMATVDAILARFTDVMGYLSPDWLTRLSERNGQLLSRLRGIQAEVDAGYQVLVDHLLAGASVEIPTHLFEIVPRDGEVVRVLMGSPDQENRISVTCDVPRASAEGLFGLFLTKQQADERYSAVRGSSEDSRLASFLEPGLISMPRASAWLGLRLRGVTPGHLYLTAALTNLQLELPGGTVAGTVSGVLQCQLVRGAQTPPAVGISGTVRLTDELHADPKPEKDPPSPESTIRSFALELRLALAA